MQPLTTIHNHHNHSQLPTTSHNHPKIHAQPPPKPPTTIHNQPKVTQKKQNLLQTAICYCTLDVNTETDLSFDSDMKQWYIYRRACVSVCMLYFVRHYIY